MSKARYQRVAWFQSGAGFALFAGDGGTDPIILRHKTDKWRGLFAIFNAMSKAEQKKAAKLIAVIAEVKPDDLL